MITLIVEAALRSLALGLVVGLALVLIRARNPHLHKIVWSTVLLASFAMPLLLAFSITPEINAPTYVLSALQSSAVRGYLLTAPAHWLQAATALYVLVALTLLARFVMGWVSIARLRRSATTLREPWTRDDDVRVSLKLHAPATFGSTILLPPDFCEWSEEKRTAVLSHERAHIRSRDCHMLWLARLHTCLFWINPMSWWLQSRLASLAETTSDDAAVSALGDGPTYAEVLLEIAASRSGSSIALAAAPMVPAKFDITTRIERILSGITPSSALRRRYRILAIAVLLPVVAVSAATLPNTDEDGPLLPRLLTRPDLTGLEQFYPLNAKRLGQNGLVKVLISLDPSGVPTYVQVLEEDPVDFGFGPAAQALAQTFRFSNPRNQPTSLKMAVKFELRGHGATQLPPPPSPAGG